MKNSMKLNSQSLPKAGILLKNINFCYNVRPIHIYSRVFGLIPYSVVQSKNGDTYEARVSVFDFVWFIISICLYLLLGFAYVQTIAVPTNPDESYILAVGDGILISMGVFSGAIMVAMDMLNRFKTVDIIKKFSIFDKKVGQFNLIKFKFQLNPIFNLKVAKLGVYFNYKKGHRRVSLWYIAILIWSTLLVLITFFSYDTILDTQTSYDILYFIAAHMSHHFVMATVLTTYFIFILYLCKRFDVLNALLRYFSSQNNFFSSTFVKIFIFKQEIFQ